VAELVRSRQHELTRGQAAATDPVEHESSKPGVSGATLSRHSARYESVEGNPACLSCCVKTTARTLRKVFPNSTSLSKSRSCQPKLHVYAWRGTRFRLCARAMASSFRWTQVFPRVASAHFACAKASSLSCRYGRVCVAAGSISPSCHRSLLIRRFFLRPLYVHGARHLKTTAYYRRQYNSRYPCHS